MIGPKLFFAWFALLSSIMVTVMAQCDCSCPAPISQISSCSCPVPSYKPRKKKRRGCPSPMPCPFPPPDPIPPICPEPPSCNVNAGGGLSFPVDANAQNPGIPVPPPPYPTGGRKRRALTHVDPAKCNNEELKRIMSTQIVESPADSKRNIQAVAATHLGGTYDVICSHHEFSYLATTKVYCEVQKGDITCFAFLHD